MIEEAATAIAAALAGALGEGVMVYPAEPETAAAPCVWLVFLEARHTTPGWVIVHEATVVADVGLAAVDAQATLAAMTDTVLGVEVPGVLTNEMVARGGGLTTRIGDVAHPCHLVTIPQLTQVC